jgi:hypothetical protein
MRYAEICAAPRNVGRAKQVEFTTRASAVWLAAHSWVFNFQRTVRRWSGATVF